MPEPTKMPDFDKMMDKMNEISREVEEWPEWKKNGHIRHRRQSGAPGGSPQKGRANSESRD